MLDKRFAIAMRSRALRSKEQKVLIANFKGSLESQDSMTELNCGGFGRIREYRDYKIHLEAGPECLPARPLKRGLDQPLPIRTQVFQLAVCNWRCWYCFVDDSLLSGTAKTARFFRAADLVGLYLDEESRAPVIDLSGGQPDLVPEWTLWMMQALEDRGLAGYVHLWADDDLGLDFLWEQLSPAEIEYMARFPHYSRVGCFKGFDEASFAFTTGAPSSSFAKQFEIFKRLLAAQFQVYAYVTFSAPSYERLEERMFDFVNRLQEVHPLLPLRTIPLRIKSFAATRRRADLVHQSTFSGQEAAFSAWRRELEKRFAPENLRLGYDEVSLA